MNTDSRISDIAIRELTREYNQCLDVYKAIYRELGSYFYRFTTTKEWYGDYNFNENNEYIDPYNLNTFEVNQCDFYDEEFRPDFFVDDNFLIGYIPLKSYFKDKELHINILDKFLKEELVNTSADERLFLHGNANTTFILEDNRKVNSKDFGEMKLYIFEGLSSWERDRLDDTRFKDNYNNPHLKDNTAPISLSLNEIGLFAYIKTLTRVDFNYLFSTRMGQNIQLLKENSRLSMSIDSVVLDPHERSYSIQKREFSSKKINAIIKLYEYITLNYRNTYKDWIKYNISNNQSLLDLFKKKLLTIIPDEERERNTYITGQAGSGKSELIKALIFSLLWKKFRGKKDKKQANIILIDPHGDLADDVYTMALKAGGQSTEDKTHLPVLIDPFLRQGFTPVINPLEFEGNEDKLNSYTEELVKVFAEILGQDFSLNAETILTPCIATLLKKKNTSLFDLQQFMDDENNSDLIELGKKTHNIAHKKFFESGIYKSNLNSTKNAVYTKLQNLLNNKTFADMTTGKSTIDLEYLMENGFNIIFKFNKSKMQKTISPLGRLIVAKIQNIALARNDIYENNRPKTHLFIDEFQNFVTPSIEESLVESRKYKLFLTLAHQVISQIESSSIRDAVLSNTNIKLVGQNGHKTLSVLSKELNVKKESLEKIEVGHFFVKIGKKEAFKIYSKPVNTFFLKVDNKKEATDLILKTYYRTYKKKEEQKPINTDIEQIEKEENIQINENTKKPKFNDF